MKNILCKVVSIESDLTEEQLQQIGAPMTRTNSNCIMKDSYGNELPKEEINPGMSEEDALKYIENKIFVLACKASMKDGGKLKYVKEEKTAYVEKRGVITILDHD